MRRQSANLMKIISCVLKDTICIFPEDSDRDHDKWKENLISQANPTAILEHCRLAHCEMASALLGLECNRCSREASRKKSRSRYEKRCHIELLNDSSVAENINVLPIDAILREWERSAKIEMFTSIAYTFICKLGLNTRHIESFLYRDIIEIIEM